MTTLISFEPGEETTPEKVAEAARAAAEGGIVAFPTDTVYGLGTSGLLPDARQRIYTIKGREPGKPLPILIHSIDEARRWAAWDQNAQLLADWFWPGPLTLVLKPTPEGTRLIPHGSQSLAIRVPAHPVALCLIEASGVPWASTSANLSGSPALAEGAAVREVFEGKVDFILDAGPCGGTESTVVDLTGAGPKVLREGSLGSKKVLEALEEG